MSICPFIIATPELLAPQLIIIFFGVQHQGQNEPYTVIREIFKAKKFSWVALTHEN